MESIKRNYHQDWNDVMYYFYVGEQVSAKAKTKAKTKTKVKTGTKPKGILGRLQTAGKSLIGLVGKATKPIRFVITKAWLVARIPALVPAGIIAVTKARKQGKKVQTKKDVEEVLKKDKEFISKIHSEVRKSKLEAVGQKGVSELIDEEDVGSPLAPIIIATIISAVAQLILKALDMSQKNKSVPQTLQELPQTEEYKSFLNELNMNPELPGGGELGSEEITPAQGLKEWIKEYWYIPVGGGAVVVLATILLTRKK